MTVTPGATLKWGNSNTQIKGLPRDGTPGSTLSTFGFRDWNSAEFGFGNVARLPVRTEIGPGVPARSLLRAGRVPDGGEVYGEAKLPANPRARGIFASEYREGEAQATANRVHPAH